MSWHYDDGTLRIGKICVGRFENNVFLVNGGRRSVIVDAAAEPDRIRALAGTTRVMAVLTTHGHRDHIGAAELAGELDVPLHIHDDDAGALNVPHLPLEHGVRFFLEDGVVVDSLHTPGHTPGSTSFLVQGGDVPVVLTGDTLFPGGPGATWSPGAFTEIIASIDTHLFSLADETLVMPGHGLDTTIGAERPHAGEWLARGW